ncbi:hypothetical protein AB6A40_001335 [Gnathostoma spinigerum]|uniref:Major antigen n=1 Tax=Gnathostoma spinigerum TaxID=75299 RepID=A0ABD6E659_9BILA
MEDKSESSTTSGDRVVTLRSDSPRGVTVRTADQTVTVRTGETERDYAVSSGAENGYSITTAGDRRIDISSRVVPESPGSRSNYGEFYWDTNGENTYHVPADTAYESETLIIDDSGYGRNISARLDRTQEDLNKYRQRIDANVEQQREYSDMMAALQHKLQEYRRHIADLESKMVARRLPDEPTSTFTIIDSSVYPDVKDYVPKRTTEDYSASYEMMARFEEERRRVEEYRIQLEQERAQNEQLQREIERIHQKFEATSQEKERAYQARERNLAQYLSEEQKKMMDLWTELQRVRRQFAELRDQTATDLENQRTEFMKVVRNVGGISRHLVQDYAGGAAPLIIQTGPGGSTTTQDSVLIEAIKRFRDTKETGPAGEQLTQELRVTGAGDSELYNELMKKYEECIERNIELESKGDDSQRKIAALEADLRRAKERLNDSQSALRKLHDISQEYDREAEGREPRKRTRSLSPGGTHIPPTDVLRSVRNVLRMRDTEIQQLKRKLVVTESQLKDMTSKLDGIEDLRKRLEKQLADSKREIDTQQKTINDAERQIRRLEDRIRSEESEKAAAEKARKYLEEEIRKLQEQYQKTILDGDKKARQEASDRSTSLEEDYKSRITELTRRIENLQKDNAKLKSDINGYRDKNRDLEAQHNTIMRRLDEKDAALKHLEDVRRTLVKEIEEHRTRYEMVSNECERFHNELDNANKSYTTSEQTLKELKQQRDEFSKQKDELTRQLFDIKHKMENEKAARVEAEKTSQRYQAEIEKLKEHITDYERQVMMLRRHNDELDTQIKSGQAKTTTLENDLHTLQKEIEKLNELNNQLQREKQDAVNQKHKTESDVTTFKETIRKLETELEKIKNENVTITEREQRTRDAYTQAANKAQVLQEQLDKARNEIEQLERKLASLRQEYEEKEVDRLKGLVKTSDSSDKVTITTEGPSVSKYHDTVVIETRVKEVNDKWRREVEKLESDKEDLEKRIRELQDQITEKNRVIERHDVEIEDLKRRYQGEIDSIKGEMGRLYDKHQNELDEEREQYRKNLDSIKLVEDELRNKLAIAEKKLAETLERESELTRENKELHEKYTSINTTLQKLRDDMEDARNEAEKEIQKWKNDSYAARSELKTLEGSNTSLKSQLNAATERCDILNKTVNDLNNKLREQSATIRRLEEELADLKSAAAVRESDLESALHRVTTLEEQYSNLQIEHSKTRSELDRLLRENDVLKATNVTQESELERLRKKISQYEVTIKEQKNTIDHIKAERDHLQNAFREKAKLADHLTQLSQTFDAKLNKMRQDLQDTSDKLIAADAERTALRSELTKLQQELQFGKDQMVRKTDEYQSALEELSNSHRQAEDGRLNALQELEQKKYELADLKSRYENMEQRLISLQQEYITADRERDTLTDALRRFHSVTNRALALHRYRAEVIQLQPEDISLKPAEPAPEFKSVPFPPAPEYPQGPRATTTTTVAETVDVSQLDSTLQSLVSRIDRLERERNEYRDALDRLKKRTSDVHTTVSTRETRYKTIEDNLTDVEEEKRAVEARLASAKQLLRSQEEALKQRDEERRTMKSKLVTAELQARGKDAQIRHLNEQLKNLRNDLDNAHADIRNLREREETWDTNKFQLESKLRDKDGEAQRLNITIVNIEAEKQAMGEKMKELSQQLQISQTKCADLGEDLERLKREITKAEKVETELRRTIDVSAKSTNDYQILRDQLTAAQNDLNNVNTRKQQLESEVFTVRNELRDHKQTIHEMNNRLHDLQRQFSDVSADKHRLEDKLQNMEKTIAQHRITESDLHSQLDAAKIDRKNIQKDLDDLRSKLMQLEGEKSRAVQQYDSNRREKIVLIKKIDMLEAEKRRTDAAIRETALQREAIEKSLSAMERENKELYKNCAQLQQQIAQLEMENGNRIIELNNRQREEQERHLQRMRNEKIQVERLIESRERTQQNRIKQLESQLAAMRDQLDAERRRRRDYIDRSLASDMGKLGGGFLGLRSTGIHSAGVPMSIPMDMGTSFDYISSGNRFSTTRTTFATNPLSPPLGTSTPTTVHYRMETSTTSPTHQYKMDTSTISLKDEDAGGRESFMSTSTYQPSTSGSVTESSSRLETLKPAKEIEEL